MRVLASDYPLFEIFGTMLWAAILVGAIGTLFFVLGDIVTTPAIGGWGKALWVLGIVLFPVLGVVVYVIVRGGPRGRHSAPVVSTKGAASRSAAIQAAAARDYANRSTRDPAG